MVVASSASTSHMLVTERATVWRGPRVTAHTCRAFPIRTCVGCPYKNGFKPSKRDTFAPDYGVLGEELNQLVR